MEKYKADDVKKKQTREASKNALKMVYYVIIGVAITEALSRVFLINGSFVGINIMFGDNRIPFILLGAFLTTVCRFTHGASIHLDILSEKRYKPLFDCVGFYLQAILFYLMAVSLKEPGSFSLSFGLMLCVDTIWLIVLLVSRYIRMDNVCCQWIVSNFILIFLLLILSSKCTSVLIWAWCVFGTALIATILDYRMNRCFYFPE